MAKSVQFNETQSFFNFFLFVQIFPYNFFPEYISRKTKRNTEQFNMTLQTFRRPLDK